MHDGERSRGYYWKWKLVRFWIKKINKRASALAIIIGKNAKKYKCFENEVKMWVYEEMIGDRKLSEIINTEHENVKYPLFIAL